MSEEHRKGLGDAVLNGIIQHSLMSHAHGGLTVWRSGSQEVIEAVIDDWYKNGIRCIVCDHYAIQGEKDEDGDFVCSGCLPPLEE